MSVSPSLCLSVSRALSLCALSCTLDGLACGWVLVESLVALRLGDGASDLVSGASGRWEGCQCQREVSPLSELSEVARRESRHGRGRASDEPVKGCELVVLSEVASREAFR